MERPEKIDLKRKRAFIIANINMKKEEIEELEEELEEIEAQILAEQKKDLEDLRGDATW